MDEYPESDQLALHDDRVFANMVEYDSETDVYRANVGSNQPASMAVISAVTAVAEVDPRESERLYEVIDPDALDDLVSKANGDDFWIEFEYAGYRIVIDGDGEIVVNEIEDCTAQ